MSELGGDAWQWSEREWRSTVERVRAGRPLRPESWPERRKGRRRPVRSTPDHESIPLVQRRHTPGPLSQGEYGARVAYLASSTCSPGTTSRPRSSRRGRRQLHPTNRVAVAERGHEIALHGWIHELNSKARPRTELDLTRRAAEVLRTALGSTARRGSAPRRGTSATTRSPSSASWVCSTTPSLMADDEPYEVLADGEPTGNRRAAVDVDS